MTRDLAVWPNVPRACPQPQGRNPQRVEKRQRGGTSAPEEHSRGPFLDHIAMDGLTLRTRCRSRAGQARQLEGADSRGESGTQRAYYPPPSGLWRSCLHGGADPEAFTTLSLSGTMIPSPASSPEERPRCFIDAPSRGRLP